MARAKNPCTVCGSPGLPGLLRGAGKCMYHWNVMCFGQEWADQIAAGKMSKMSLSRRVTPTLERPHIYRSGGRWRVNLATVFRACQQVSPEVREARLAINQAATLWVSRHNLSWLLQPED